MSWRYGMIRQFREFTKGGLVKGGLAMYAFPSCNCNTLGPVFNVQVETCLIAKHPFTKPPLCELPTQLGLRETTTCPKLPDACLADGAYNLYYTDTNIILILLVLILLVLIDSIYSYTYTPDIHNKIPA